MQQQSDALTKLKCTTSRVPVKLSQLPAVEALVHSMPLRVLAAWPPLPQPPLCHTLTAVPFV